MERNFIIKVIKGIMVLGVIAAFFRGADPEAPFSASRYQVESKRDYALQEAVKDRVALLSREDLQSGSMDISFSDGANWENSTHGANIDVVLTGQHIADHMNKAGVEVKVMTSLDEFTTVYNIHGQEGFDGRRAGLFVPASLISTGKPTIFMFANSEDGSESSMAFNEVLIHEVGHFFDGLVKEDGIPKRISSTNEFVDAYNEDVRKLLEGGFSGALKLYEHTMEKGSVTDGLDQYLSELDVELTVDEKSKLLEDLGLLINNDYFLPFTRVKDLGASSKDLLEVERLNRVSQREAYAELFSIVERNRVRLSVDLPVESNGLEKLLPQSYEVATEVSRGLKHGHAMLNNPEQLDPNSLDSTANSTPQEPPIGAPA